jgi:peroxisomal membrane protein 2
LVAVEKYPIRTKCITAWIIFIAADTLAQVIEYRLTILDQETQTHPSYGGSITTGSTRNTNIDWIRAMRFGALGLFGAPWSHYYFQWLDHHLPPSEEPFTRRTAIKVGIDQFVQAPILLAIMIFSLSLMKGQGFNGARQDLTNTFMISLIANCTIKKKFVVL